MNAIRTIQAGELPWWVNAASSAQPVAGGPDVPIRFPFPFHPRQPLAGGFLYVLYRGAVERFAPVATVLPHQGDFVGTTGQAVGPGSFLELAGPLQLMQRLTARGFMGIRYTPAPLHRMPLPAAQHALNLALR
jgi:hypothetical protein